MVDASLKATEDTGEVMFLIVGDHADYSGHIKTVQVLVNWLNNPRIQLFYIPAIKDASTPGVDIKACDQINDLLHQTADWSQVAELLYKVFSEKSLPS